jgi:cobalt-precorrin-5B (C1)-methyltransferase
LFSGFKVAKKGLRIGFSTGSAASAAAKAAFLTLLKGAAPGKVEIALPSGVELTIAVEEARKITDKKATATVIKDAGDDPDITHKAAICALVEMLSDKGKGESIQIRGGRGVGRVTRPGLPTSIGEPAINPTPRDMIREAVLSVWRDYSNGAELLRVAVEISVPDGELLAKTTLNPRLGIVGGISILGTTGLVKPFSHEAYTATIESALAVAKASGAQEIVITTGGRSEKYAMALRPDLPDYCFVQVADFFGFSLEKAVEAHFARVGAVSFFGKAVKQAQGLYYTHAHKAPMDLLALAEWLRDAGAGPALVESVAKANTARHALEILRDSKRLDLVAEVGIRMFEEIARKTENKPDIWAVILDYDGEMLFEKDLRGGAR